MTELEKRLYGRSLPELIGSMSKFRRLEACWSLIERDFASEELALGPVSRQSGISENHLNRRLKESVGLSFQELLHRHRLHLACRMLREKDYNLLEVAQEKGFGNPSSLRRYCQQAREYRERFRRTTS